MGCECALVGTPAKSGPSLSCPFLSHKHGMFLRHRGHGQDRRMGGRERTRTSNWCHTKARSSPRPKRHGQLHTQNTPECTSSKQDLGLVPWASRMETTEFHGDLAMPGIMHWWLLWYSAPSHLNEILIKGCVFQLVMIKQPRKPWRHHPQGPLEKGTRQGLHSWHRN